MSDNLDLVRSIFDGWERGDFTSAAWADPEIVFESTGFDAVRSSGVAAMAELFREWMSTWDEYTVQADEFQELDGGRVVVLMRHGGRGKGSGVAIDDMKAGANVF